MKRLFVILCFLGLCTAAFCRGNADNSSQSEPASGSDTAPATGTIDSSLPLEQQLQQARRERQELQRKLEQEQSERTKLEKELETIQQERRKLEQEMERLNRREKELLSALERQYFQTVLPGIYGGSSPGHKGFGVGLAWGMYEHGSIVPYLHTMFSINSCNYFTASGLWVYNDGAFSRALVNERYSLRFGKESAFSFVLHNSNVFYLDDTANVGGVVSGDLKFYGSIGSYMDILLSAGVPVIYLDPGADWETQDRVGFAGLLKPSFYIMDGLFSLSAALAYNTADSSVHTMNETNIEGLLYGGSINFNFYKGCAVAFEYQGNLGSAGDGRSELAFSASAKTGVLFLWGRLPYGNILTGGERAFRPSFGAELRF
ncbi:MAG: hypothetical protein LBK05_03355 [Treponema sp.]|jgi:hypothetical protein|nr:hypothetical protein [Treponema sp.]